MSSRERWTRVVAVFEAALEVEPERRRRFVEERCAGDAALLEEVERLLADDARAHPLLDDPEAPMMLAEDAATERDPLIGAEVGSYRIVERIARGGMGVVYRGIRADGRFEREVAVKAVRGLGGAELLRRFALEQKALAALDHPHIARLLDAGAGEDGQPFLVMELVRGRPIDVHCDEQRLEVRQRLRLFATVGRAVHHAHQRLVLHRDLKPANVLVATDGTPKLLDFGIASLLRRDAPAGETGGRRPYTPGYASPEQVRGDTLTTASDVFSLGVMLHVLLTGEKPVAGPGGEARLASAAAIDAEVAAARRTTPRRLSHALRGDLDAIVRKALRPAPAERYPSALELSEDVERHLDRLPVTARPAALGYRGLRFARRHRLPVALALLLAATLGTGAVVSWRMARSAEAGRLRAERAERDALADRDRARLSEERARADSITANHIADFVTRTLLEAGALSAPGERSRAERRLVDQAERVRRQFAREPRVQASLLDALGALAGRLGLFDAGERLILSALELREGVEASDDGEVARGLRSLGGLLYRRGDPAGAVGPLERSLELERGRAVPADLALAANDLAAAVRALGETRRAEALHREALELRRAGGSATAVAESLNNLSGVLADQGRLDEAVLHQREALALRRRTIGPGHPETVQTASNLAVLHLHAGDPDAAEAILEDAAAQLREMRAAGREGLAHVLRNLGELQLAGGRPDAAARSIEEAIESAEAAFGPEHPSRVRIRSVRARVLAARGETDRAAAEFEAVRRRARTDLPAGDAAAVLQHHGAFALQQEDFELAASVFEEAVELARRSPPDASLGLALVWLGMAQEGANRPAEAETAWTEAAAVLEEAGDHARAEELRRKVEVLRRRRLDG